ncbi:hypothetical protein ACLOJK_023639 [Asimina triloba]
MGPAERLSSIATEIPSEGLVGAEPVVLEWSDSAGDLDTATGATSGERAITVWRRFFFFFSLSAPSEEDINTLGVARCAEVSH